MRLNNKRVFVTGGTGGIGQPLVELLKKEGAFVTVHDRSKNGDLLGHLGPLCRQLADFAPDILIQLAGKHQFEVCEQQNVDELIDLNLKVPMKLTQAVLPAMKARGNGHIVHVGSMLALIPVPHQTGYVAAKSGLKGFNDALRRELVNTGVVVTYVAPRAVKTAMNTGRAALVNQLTKASEDSAQVVGQRILQAILRKESDVRIGWPERLYAVVQGLFPWLIDIGLSGLRMAGESVLRTPNSDTSMVRRTS